MATLLQNATKLNQDRESLIEKYNSVEGMSVSSDATFSDLVDEFDNLPIGGSGLDWTAIGYDSTPHSIVEGYNYAKQIYDNWDSTVTSLSGEYSSNTELIYFPLVDTSNVTNMEYIFSGCSRLKEIPLIDTSNVTLLRGAFSSCSHLTYIPVLNTSKLETMKDAFSSVLFLNDTALDNILQMCVNAASYIGTKTLSVVGLSQTYYPVSRIQALSHYQDFIDAGWTIGY